MAAHTLCLKSSTEYVQNCTLSPIQTTKSRVWELQTGRHIFWISGEKWGRKWKSDAVFPIFAGWGLTTGLSPSVTLWTHQWNLDTGSADDEKYERGRHNTLLFHTSRSKGHTHSDTDVCRVAIATSAVHICSFRHIQFWHRGPENQTETHPFIYTHTYKGYCQSSSRVEIFVILLPKVEVDVSWLFEKPQCSRKVPHVMTP